MIDNLFCCKSVSGTIIHEAQDKVLGTRNCEHGTITLIVAEGRHLGDVAGWRFEPTSDITSQNRIDIHHMHLLHAGLL